MNTTKLTFITTLLFLFSNVIFAQNMENMMKSESNQQEVFTAIMNNEDMMKRFSQRLSSHQQARETMMKEMMQNENMQGMMMEKMMRDPQHRQMMMQKMMEKHHEQLMDKMMDDPKKMKIMMRKMYDRGMMDQESMMKGHQMMEEKDKKHQGHH